MIKARSFIAISIFFGFGLLGQFATIGADQNKPTQWVPMPLDEIRSIIENNDLPALEKATRLAHELDKRISVTRLEGAKFKADAAHDYVFLISFIAAPGIRVDTPRRPEIVQSILDKLNTIPDIENKAEVQSYLYIALGIAGGQPPESELLKFINNRQTSQELISAALLAMQQSRSGVPVRAVPRLLEFLHHPWNGIVYGSDVGPPQPGRRVYPIREAACNALNALGIKCAKTLIKENKTQPQSLGDVVFTPVIKLDRASLVAKLRAWLLSDDPQVWQPAAEIVRQIPGQDAQAMLHQLLQSGKLSAPKRAVIQKHSDL